MKTIVFQSHFASVCVKQNNIYTKFKAQKQNPKDRSNLIFCKFNIDLQGFSSIKICKI